jgi:hypothetical protein
VRLADVAAAEDSDVKSHSLFLSLFFARLAAVLS